MNAFGVRPKDVGLLPGRAGPGEDVAVGVERLLKSDDVGPFAPHLAVLRFAKLPALRGITRATFFEDPQPARGKPASAAQSMRSGRAAG